MPCFTPIQNRELLLISVLNVLLVQSIGFVLYYTESYSIQYRIESFIVSSNLSSILYSIQIPFLYIEQRKEFLLLFYIDVRLVNGFSYIVERVLIQRLPSILYRIIEFLLYRFPSIQDNRVLVNSCSCYIGESDFLLYTVQSVPSLRYCIYTGQLLFLYRIERALKFLLYYTEYLSSILFPLYYTESCSILPSIQQNRFPSIQEIVFLCSLWFPSVCIPILYMGFRECCSLIPIYIG